MRFVKFVFWCSLFVSLVGCSLPSSATPVPTTQARSSVATARPTRIPRATPTKAPPPNGVLASTVPNRPTPTPLADDQIPPSLLITNLIPFRHDSTGIVGVRPDNWTLFEGKDSFQISSSPNAPDGFIGALRMEKDLKVLSQKTLARFKSNQSDGPEPVVLQDDTAPDGSGVLLVEVSGRAQGSTKSFRYTLYARTTITPKGLLLAFAQVPQEQFAAEESLVRQMVDSLHLEN